VIDTDIVAADGPPFAYRRAGDRSDPLVFRLHGFPDDAGAFDPVLDRLADADEAFVGECRVARTIGRRGWPAAASRRVEWLREERPERGDGSGRSVGGSSSRTVCGRRVRER